MSWIKDSQGNNKWNLIKKFTKTIFFLAKKKWIVKNNFEETIEYLANLGVDNIFQYINNAPKNFKYISTFSAEQFLVYMFFRTWWYKPYEWGTKRPSTFDLSHCTSLTIP